MEYTFSISEHNVIYAPEVPAEAKNPAFCKELKNAIKFVNKYASEKTLQVATIYGSHLHGVMYIKYKTGQVMEVFSESYDSEFLQFLVHLISFKAWSLISSPPKVPNAGQGSLF